jgi:hypothetical protein
MHRVLIGAVAVAMIGGVASAEGTLVVASQDKSSDRIPTFNVEPSCRGAAARSTVPMGATENTTDVCVRKENDAREQIVKEWGTFSAADRSYCVPLSMQGGRPTYTELLTCLELAREARNLKDKESSGTTGMGGGSIGRTAR